MAVSVQVGLKSKGAIRMKKGLRGLCIGLAGVLLLSGCGSKSAGSQEIAHETNAAAMDAGEYMGYERDDAMVAETTAGSEAASMEVVQEGRKLIRTTDMTVETTELDVFLTQLQAKVAEFGGYFEEAYQGGNASEPGSRYAGMTIRVPEERLDALLIMVGQGANVLYKNESTRDVTLDYTDVEAHKESLTVENDRLLELLAQAESIEDVLAIESRLSEVRYQLESYESQLRTLDNQINYSTLYLSVQEVRKETLGADVSAWTRIKEGFGESLISIGEGAKNFFIGFIIAIPYLVVAVVVLLVLILGVRKVRKGKNKTEHKDSDKDTQA